MKSPSVYGRLVDRYLFNFRVDPDVLQSHLPVDWLRPRLVNGHGVVSFCLLRLRGVTLWPAPTFMGVDSTSCAYRIAVTDVSGKQPEPSVYILGRSTNVPLVSRLGTALFAGEMKLVDSEISDGKIRVAYRGGKKLFEARVRPRNGMHSVLFGSTDEFVSFIKGGFSSYTPSTKTGHYSRVDLVEDSNHYVPIDATVENSQLHDQWKDSSVVFDSAFHATGGRYRLRYLGSSLGQQNPSIMREVACR